MGLGRVCGGFVVEQGAEKGKPNESKSLKGRGELTFKGVFRVSFGASGIKKVVAAKAWRQGGHPSMMRSSYLNE